MKMKMLKWVAWKCPDYEEAEIIGVFDTREAAEQAIDEHTDQDSFEWGNITLENVTVEVDMI